MDRIAWAGTDSVVCCPFRPSQAADAMGRRQRLPESAVDGVSLAGRVGAGQRSCSL